jgi:hypothetical protein
MTQPSQTGGELIRAALEVVALVDDAEVDVRCIDLAHSYTHFQLANEDDVDRAVGKLGGADPDSGATTNYSRLATVDGLTVLRLLAPH